MIARLKALVDALASRAEGCGDAAMPSYTHLRKAQPILAAHFFLAHAAAFRRDAGRFDRAIDEADEMPLGSGAIAGTTCSVDTRFLAERLGFSRVVANSLDASSDRDFVATFLFGCSLAMVHLSRLAEDVIIFTSEEFGYFDLPDRFATGSSLMPQKKNPDPLELARGKSGRVLGRLSGWLTTMKGLPGGYNRDLQEDKEAVFEAEATLAASLDACAAVVAGLSLNAARAEAAASGLLLATDVADYLVARGVAFRDAHATVGAIVRTARRRGPRLLVAEPRRVAGVQRSLRAGRRATPSRRARRWPPSARRSRRTRRRSGRRSTSCGGGSTRVGPVTVCFRPAARGCMIGATPLAAGPPRAARAAHDRRGSRFPRVQGFAGTGRPAAPLFLPSVFEGLRMLPRQLRVGDLVDDYCPRERRLSNHAIVALVGEDVRQVRCTTCDAEHEYPRREGAGRAARRRRVSRRPAAAARAVVAEAGAPEPAAMPPAAAGEASLLRRAGGRVPRRRPATAIPAAQDAEAEAATSRRRTRRSACIGA